MHFNCATGAHTITLSDEGAIYSFGTIDMANWVQEQLPIVLLFQFM